MSKVGYNKYVKSKYNVYLSNYFVFNTWSGALIQLEEDKYEKLKTNDFTDIDDDILNKLLLTKMITLPVDEFDRICNENKEFLKNNSKFSIVIAPTSKCNAKCAYCFEKGIKAIDMDDTTRDSIVKYIESQGKNKDVHITWFGGEPLIGAKYISMICDRLIDRNVNFVSSMITNGFLLDKHILDAKNKWNLRRVQITLDDTFEAYDSIKKIQKGAFQRVINNIHLCCDNGISVSIRVNFDSERYKEYLHIIDYVKNEFGNKVSLYFHDIIGENYLTPNQVSPNPMIEISEHLIKYGFIKNLPDLKIKRTMTPCGLEKENFINVFPDGSASRCEHFLGKDSEFSCGNINDSDFIPRKYVRNVYDECRNCICFPICGGGCSANHKIGYGYGCTIIKTGLRQILDIYVKEVILNENFCH